MGLLRARDAVERVVAALLRALDESNPATSGATSFETAAWGNLLLRRTSGRVPVSKV